MERIGRPEEATVCGHGHAVHARHEADAAGKIALTQAVEVELLALAKADDHGAVIQEAFGAVYVERMRCAAAGFERFEGGKLVGYLVLMKRLRHDVDAQDVALAGCRVCKDVVVVMLARA